MGDQQYALHYQIEFFHPRKPGRIPAYPINPIHGDIAVADQQYQNDPHDYHLVNSMNISLKKIVVAVIDNQWLKG